jgi:hypothetical protein
MSNRFRSSIFCLPVFALAGLVLMISIASTPSFATNDRTQSYVGTAFGTSAFVGNTVLVGQTAPVTLGGTCGTSRQPLNITASTAGVNLPPIVSGGAANTQVTSSPQSATATANTATISLLAGLISAQAIKAASETTLQSNGTFQVSSAGSTFSNLVILGHVYNGSVPANTQINLPLIGYIVLNEQISTISNATANLTVNMIHIHITVLNILGLQVGTEIIVSSATSGMFSVYSPAILNGGSFGTQVTGNLLASAPTAPVILPCLGTNGAVITNTLTGINLPTILNTGVVTDTGESDLTNDESSGKTTSMVAGLNLLNGLVTVNAMTGQVYTVVNDNIAVFTTAVDTFVGISVAGHPEITDNVAYNTNINLAGLGTLYLKRILHAPPPAHSTEIRSLELVINQNNSYGLPIGLDLIVGDALIQVIPDANP